jgi:hypothetical protein
MAIAHAVSAIRTYFQVKYSDKAARLVAMQAAYITLYEAKGADIGKTLTSFGADGQNASWAVGLSTDQQLSAFAAALKAESGTGSSTVRLFARDGIQSPDQIV